MLEVPSSAVRAVVVAMVAILYSQSFAVLAGGGRHGRRRAGGAARGLVLWLEVEEG